MDRRKPRYGYNRTMAIARRGWKWVPFIIVGLALCQQAFGAGADASEQSSANHQAIHHFWDRENILLFSGVGAFRALDYASTRNFQARGREETLLPDDVVNNSAGFASLEAAATATSVGLS